MSTQKQTGANRLNAQKSTGPRTAPGKSRSSMNALKSGLHAASMVLPGENAAELEALIAEYHDYHEPASPEMRALCDKLARGEWIGRRLSIIESNLLTYEIQTLYQPRADCFLGQAFKDCSQHLARLQHYISATDREYHRNLKLLHTLEAQQLGEAADPIAQPSPEPPPPPPDPEPEPEPELSTAQPAAATNETPQMASFRQTPFRPGHPAAIEDCPNCRTLGYMSPGCRYDPRQPKEA